jgi:aminoglycoside phosphotransferase (APT) family kinase protein
MEEPLPDLVSLLRQIDPTLELLGAERLEGGISAGVFALQLRSPAIPSTAVLRVLPADATLDGAEEARLLDRLARAGYPVPAVLGHCIANQGAPAGALLLEHVDGAKDMTPDAERVDHCAALLLRLHDLPCATFEPFPRQPDHPLPERWTGLDATRVHALRDLAVAHPPERTGATVLCHGDFWPGNLLWRRERAVVLDWEDAGFGDRLLDLAVARLELAWEAGIPAMERFTDSYVNGSADPDALRAALPTWDLHVTLLRLAWLPGWGLPEAVEGWSLAVGLHHAERAAASLEPRFESRT